MLRNLRKFTEMAKPVNACNARFSECYPPPLQRTSILTRTVKKMLNLVMSSLSTGHPLAQDETMLLTASELDINPGGGIASHMFV